MSTCERCQEDLRPHAKFCGHCGLEITKKHAIERVRDDRVSRHVEAMPLVPEHSESDELAMQVQLESSTRLNPLMNQERIKAMVMAIAAQGSHGLVGLWSDD